MEQSISFTRLYLFFRDDYDADSIKQETNMNTVTQSRSIERLVEGVATSDGAGVSLTRVLTGKLQRRLDPFLMLDAFGSDDPDDYIAGFPDHPHRGFETVTYMLHGRMRHRDNAGHEGLLGDGGVQWMIAGRGVIHSEIPEQEDGVMEGFQLWLNLPAQHKMRAPWYQDFPSASIPEYTTPDGVTVRVIAGDSNGVKGAMTREVTEPLYLDIHIPAGSEFSTAIPASHNAFIYVYRGRVKVGDTAVETQRMGILSNISGADGVTLAAPEDARLILVAGKPLNEPIVQYGPFVMNTQEEIHRALDDFRNGHFA
jgi:redox-sensitive bicupin YhaK (pirin superfamily)